MEYYIYTKSLVWLKRLLMLYSIKKSIVQFLCCDNVLFALQLLLKNIWYFLPLTLLDYESTCTMKGACYHHYFCLFIFFVFREDKANCNGGCWRLKCSKLDSVSKIFHQKCDLFEKIQNRIYFSFRYNENRYEKIKFNVLLDTAGLVKSECILNFV